MGPLSVMICAIVWNAAVNLATVVVTALISKFACSTVDVCLGTLFPALDITQWGQFWKHLWVSLLKCLHKGSFSAMFLFAALFLCPALLQWLSAKISFSTEWLCLESTPFLQFSIDGLHSFGTPNGGLWFDARSTFSCIGPLKFVTFGTILLNIAFKPLEVVLFDLYPTDHCKSMSSSSMFAPSLSLIVKSKCKRCIPHRSILCNTYCSELGCLAAGWLQ